MKTGRIYKIIASEGNEVYVGSTFNTIRDRFQQHKNDFKKGKNDISVYDMFEKYGFDGCKMILIKEYEVEDRKHLEVYETLWIKKMNAINKVQPFGNKIKELRKQYFKKYSKMYREENKELLSKKSKLYREENKERKRETNRIYREKNKEKISEKIECECGSRVRRGGLATHKKTAKHIKFSEN